MKKFILFILCLLVISPCAFILSACGSQTTYSISVRSSDARYGSVTGDGIYAEGSQITLRANTKEEESKFLCWTYNDKIVSADAEFKLNVSSTTYGTYVAVFNKGCEYYALANAQLKKSSANNLKFDSLNFKVTAGSSLKAMKVLCDTTLETAVNASEQTFNLNIENQGFQTGYLFHKKLDAPDYYSAFEISTSTGGTVDHTFSGLFSVNFSELRTNDPWTTDEIAIEGFGTISLKIAKINEELVKKVLGI